MSIFKETYGTRCLGQADPQCVNFINKKVLPPTKRFCDCAGKVEQLERTNWKAVGVAAALAVILVGGGAYAAYSNIPSFAEVFGGAVKISDSGGDPGRIEPQKNNAKDVTLRIASGAGESVPLDHAFLSGDQFRFLMRGPSSEHVYCFYEDKDSRKMVPLASGAALSPAEDTNVPTGGAVKLDDHPGRETFQFIVSPGEIAGLNGTEPLDRASFDDVLKDVKSHGGLTNGQFQSRGSEVLLASGGNGATRARVELTHR